MKQFGKCCLGILSTYGETRKEPVDVTPMWVEEILVLFVKTIVIDILN